MGNMFLHIVLPFRWPCSFGVPDWLARFPTLSRGYRFGNTASILEISEAGVGSWGILQLWLPKETPISRWWQPKFVLFSPPHPPWLILLTFWRVASMNFSQKWQLKYVLFSHRKMIQFGGKNHQADQIFRPKNLCDFWTRKRPHMFSCLPTWNQMHIITCTNYKGIDTRMNMHMN